LCGLGLNFDTGIDNPVFLQPHKNRCYVVTRIATDCQKTSLPFIYGINNINFN